MHKCNTFRLSLMHTMPSEFPRKGGILFIRFSSLSSQEYNVTSFHHTINLLQWVETMMSGFSLLFKSLIKSLYFTISKKSWNSRQNEIARSLTSWVLSVLPFETVAVLFKITWHFPTMQVPIAPGWNTEMCFRTHGGGRPASRFEAQIEGYRWPALGHGQPALLQK